MHIDYPHNLPQQEARARLEALGDYLRNKHGIGVTWSGDQAAIAGRYKIVKIEGAVQLKPGSVVFDGKDPGLLWRKQAKEYLTYKLSRYLDPGTPVDQLPRR